MNRIFSVKDVYCYFQHYCYAPPCMKIGGLFFVGIWRGGLSVGRPASSMEAGTHRLTRSLCVAQACIGWYVGRFVRAAEVSINHFRRKNCMYRGGRYLTVRRYTSLVLSGGSYLLVCSYPPRGREHMFYRPGATIHRANHGPVPTLGLCHAMTGLHVVLSTDNILDIFHCTFLFEPVLAVTAA